MEEVKINTEQSLTEKEKYDSLKKSYKSLMLEISESEKNNLKLISMGHYDDMFNWRSQAFWMITQKTKIILHIYSKSPTAQNGVLLVPKVHFEKKKLFFLSLYSSQYLKYEKKK